MSDLIWGSEERRKKSILERISSLSLMILLLIVMVKKYFLKSLKFLKSPTNQLFLGESSTEGQNDFREEDFMLLEGDVITEFIDRAPSLKFSDQVHDFFRDEWRRWLL